jgi:hypothetical protein
MEVGAEMSNQWSAQQWTEARIPEEALRGAIEEAGGHLIGVYGSGVPVVAGLSYAKTCEVASEIATPKKRKRGRPRKEAINGD